MRFSVDKAGIESVNRIQELEEELNDVRNEVEMKTKNFKIRINVVESHNSQLLQEKQNLEDQLAEETERLKNKLKFSETTCESAKEDLKNRIQQARETEAMLKDANR